MKQDAYTIITDKLIELIESTEGEQWQMPWHHQLVLPQNATSKKAYRGVNTISLWVGQMANGYQSLSCPPIIDPENKLVFGSI